MSHKAPVLRWRTQDIMVFVRFGLDRVPTRVLGKRARVYGALAVHPPEFDEFVPHKDRPESWYVTFKHPSIKTQRWVVSHAITGRRFSGGPQGGGFRLKQQAHEFVHILHREFPSVLAPLPLLLDQDKVIATLKARPLYDDMVARIRQLEQELL
jgi:hypothetical protein